jgi:hypothetical protein
LFRALPDASCADQEDVLEGGKRDEMKMMTASTINQLEIQYNIAMVHYSAPESPSGRGDSVQTNSLTCSSLKRSDAYIDGTCMKPPKSEP